MHYVTFDLDLHYICITKKNAVLNTWVKSAQESVTQLLQGLNIIYFNFLII